jgi:hypothetical protein
LPVLVIVFLISYGVMTMLIVEQGEAIQQQHGLIQVLMSDSLQLWSAKSKAADKAAHAQVQPGAPCTQVPPVSNHAPSTQVPATPSTQAMQHAQNHAGKDAKPHIQLPPVPASDLGDQRRVLITL